MGVNFPLNIAGTYTFCPLPLHRFASHQATPASYTHAFCPLTPTSHFSLLFGGNLVKYTLHGVCYVCRMPYRFRFSSVRIKKKENARKYGWKYNNFFIHLFSIHNWFYGWKSSPFSGGMSKKISYFPSDVLVFLITIFYFSLFSTPSCFLRCLLIFINMNFIKWVEATAFFGLHLTIHYHLMLINIGIQMKPICIWKEHSRGSFYTMFSPPRSPEGCISS